MELKTTPLNIIFDTDAGSDCDDMMALGYLIQAQKEKKIKINAVTYSHVCPYGAAALRATFRYFGEDAPPVGVMVGGMGGFAETEVELLLECDFGEIGEVSEKVARVQHGIVILFEAEDVGEAAGIALVTPFGAEVAGADGGNRKIFVLVHRAVGDRFVFHYFMLCRLVESIYPHL